MKARYIVLVCEAQERGYFPPSFFTAPPQLIRYLEMEQNLDYMYGYIKTSEERWREILTFLDLTY